MTERRRQQRKKDFDSEPAAKAGLKALATRADMEVLRVENKAGLKALSKRFDKKLQDNTNLLIEEISKDIRHGDERIVQEIKALRDDSKPRVLTIENKQDNHEQRLDNHEARLKKLETVPI
ncbi:MAG: hypothetical protein HY747_12505 [Elusimicrobia bacterium]|nr:hypothetical protein [Elusimicrobiota bacterium]